MTAYYQKHIFICTNQKPDGKKCCGQAGSDATFLYAKQQLRQRELHGPGKIRMSKSGCLGRCEEGPSMVIYPEGVWYRLMKPEDFDVILEQHLLKGQIVEQLLMTPSQAPT